MKCLDCNGSGKYFPLIGPPEKCLACKGSGQNGKLFVPKEFADESIIKNTVLTRFPYVWLAQRSDYAKYHLTTGRWYLEGPPAHPVDEPYLGERVLMFDINHNYPRDVCYREGFTIHTDPKDKAYDDAMRAYGTSTLIERGYLLTGRIGSQNLKMAQFFASEDTMGIAFCTEILNYKTVYLGRSHDVSSGLYIPKIVKGI